MITTARTPKLDLKITARAGRPHVAFLRKMLRRAHALLRSPLRELSLALVGDARMSQLHSRFMDDPSPTDVLTFPLEQNSRAQATSGEVVVNFSEAIRQARRRGFAVQNELLLYALHGMLHLMGLDDRTDADYIRMHRLEDRILTQLGVGAVFNPSRKTSSKTS
ncbi:MAG TPA: rRNA maturation RNase YbeY [Tepidisphaeraceae bacterium]|jgi:probable rRNA maturation factor|nr:rRNA maturation RNase YbeY [Tepidisphaeraceae bacterium]